MNLLWGELLTWTNKNHMGFVILEQGNPGQKNWAISIVLTSNRSSCRGAKVVAFIPRNKRSRAWCSSSEWFLPWKRWRGPIEEPCVLVRLRTIHVYNICIYIHILYRYVLWYIIYSFIPIYHIIYGHTMYLWWYILYYCWATVVEGCTLDVVKCIHACICGNATIHRKIFDLCSSSNWFFYLFGFATKICIYIYKQCQVLFLRSSKTSFINRNNIFKNFCITKLQSLEWGLNDNKSPA